MLWMLWVTLSQREGWSDTLLINQTTFIFHLYMQALTFAHFLFLLLVAARSHIRTCTSGWAFCVFFFWCVKKREQFDNNDCACVCVCVSAPRNAANFSLHVFVSPQKDDRKVKKRNSKKQQTNRGEGQRRARGGPAGWCRRRRYFIKYLHHYAKAGFDMLWHDCF